MGRLIMVSNRIPTEAEPAGGLVVALHECLTQQGGLWIGSSGEEKQNPESELREIGRGAYTRLAYDMTPAEYEDFYLGYANSVLWPLFHHRADLIDLQPGYAEAYMTVNRRVANMIADIAQPDDAIWIHDYHFLPLARDLRQMGFEGRIGFFLHIPFPTAANLPALPEAKELIEWVGAYDLFGLQTRRDVSACLEVLRLSGQAEMLGDGSVKLGDHRVNVANFPIGIDADSFARLAENSEDINIPLSRDTKLVLGVDRLDYSKGLVNRFEGFNAYIEDREDHMPRATLIQIAPPSREDVEAYRDIRAELERLSGSINGAHAELDWTPIRYIRRPVDREKLAVLYRRAHVALVTPLADGMNLVAKEYVAAQDPDDPGVLVLSHFAGASEQLKDALFVNPYDTQQMGRVIGKALTMPLSERIRRHESLLASVREQDIAWWTDQFLEQLGRVGSPGPEAEPVCS